MTRTLTILWIVFFAGSLHAQSLADAAKKAEEKRGAATTAPTGKTRVYTKKDVDALPPEIVTSPAKAPDTEASAAAPSEPESTVSPGPNKDEAYWKGRMAPLRAQLDSYRQTLSTARAELRNLEVYMMPTQWNWSVYGLEWQRRTNEVSSLEKIVRDAEKRVADLEEEGRVAGALPGWLR